MDAYLALFSSGSGGDRAGRAPPLRGPVKFSHKKDGCWRRPHRFHVSRPTPPPPSRWIRYCNNLQMMGTMNRINSRGFICSLSQFWQILTICFCKLTSLQFILKQESIPVWSIRSACWRYPMVLVRRGGGWIPIDDSSGHINSPWTYTLFLDIPTLPQKQMRIQGTQGPAPHPKFWGPKIEQFCTCKNLTFCNYYCGR